MPRVIAYLHSVNAVKTHRGVCGEEVLHYLETWVDCMCIELLACISLMFGCFLLPTFALSILVSYLSLLTWKLIASLFVIATSLF